ncbi:ABC transporter substrate-binding protein [Bdellovibrionota bacterium FG-1]
MRHITTNLLTTRMILALTGILIVTGCTHRENDGNLAVFHGQLKDDVKTWDPANAYDSVSLEVVPSVYEALYQYSYLSDTYKLVPLLAADMPKISADRLTYTIPIRHGIKFQDDPCFKNNHGKGRDLKAQDFIYAWKRLALPPLDSQGWWIFDGKIVGINAFHDNLVKVNQTPQTPQTPKDLLSKAFAENIEGMKALDDFTLQIKLTKPYPQLMWVLAMTFTAPVAEEATTQYADDRGNLTDHAVGTGPFFLKKWDRGHRVILERNPTFHTDFYPTNGALDYRKLGLLTDAGKLLPFLDRLTFDVMRESQPRWLGFMNGDQDLLDIPKDNFGQAVSNRTHVSPDLAAKGARLNIETGVVFRYVSFNVKDKLFENKYLRQALSAAIDREKWIDLFTNGTGKKMTHALPPGTPDRPAQPKLKYDFDLKLAKDLLKKAGFPEGQGLPLIHFDLRGADTVSRQLGDFFTQQWGAIGIKVNVIANTFPAFLEKMKLGQWQTSIGGWSMDYPDGENVFQLMYGPNKSPGPNDTNYDNPEMNKLYEQIAVTEPGPTRAATIEKIDEILQEDCPWAYGYYEATYMLTQPWILNYRVADIIQNKYKYLQVNREIKKRYQANR